MKISSLMLSPLGVKAIGTDTSVHSSTMMLIKRIESQLVSVMNEYITSIFTNIELVFTQIVVRGKFEPYNNVVYGKID